MASKERFSGAVLDGPLFGKNLGHREPQVRIAVTPKVAVRTQSFDLVASTEIKYFWYVWEQRLNAWKLK